jgi:hypothetical protein
MSFLIAFRCERAHYSFLGWDLGEHPHASLVVLLGFIAFIEVVHLCLLKRRASFFWCQSALLLVSLIGACIFSLVKAQEGGQICTGEPAPSPSLLAQAATEDGMIKLVLAVSSLLLLVTIENILGSFLHKEWRFQPYKRSKTINLSAIR